MSLMCLCKDCLAMVTSTDRALPPQRKSDTISKPTRLDTDRTSSRA